MKPRTPPRTSPGRGRKIGRLPLILLVGSGLTAAGYFILPFLRDTETPQPDTPQVHNSAVGQMRTEGTALLEGFRRGLTLGLTLDMLEYGTGGAFDLAGALNLLPAPMPVQIVDLSDHPPARWFLGGGQMTGPYQADAPDLAFFVTPLPLDLCRKLNRTIWGDTQDAPVMTGVPIEDWENRKANILEVFGGNNRTEACITTAEGKHLYYRLVYGTVTPATPAESNPR